MLKKIFSLFLLSALVLSCEKSNKKIYIYQESNPGNQNLFISGIINGNLWYAKNGENGCQYYTSHNYSQNYPVLTIDYSASFSQGNTPQSITAWLPGWLHINMENCKYISQDYFSNSQVFGGTFQEGQQMYYVQGSNSAGVEVEYYDENYNLWSTKYGSQAGSTFNFSSVSDSFSGEKQEKFCEGTYSCKVYRDGNPSQYKVITNGSFSVKYEKMN